jgi:hypothetical protein
VVETGDTFAHPPSDPNNELWSIVENLSVGIKQAQTQADLDAIKPSIKEMEADHPEAFRDLVAEWQARAKVLAPPPSRTDALKARMRKAAAVEPVKTIEIVDADDKPVIPAEGK